MEGADLSFIHLGISVHHMVKSFSIGGISFAYYGLIIGIGMIAGLLVAQSDAKRRGQDPDIYLDFMLYGIIFSILGARLYYVIFQWGYYREHLTEILNLRKGGLAIYGGVIAGTLTLLVFTRKRKLSFLSLADSACLGLLTGQIIGRWGNFVNCEAFGGYTEVQRLIILRMVSRLAPSPRSRLASKRVNCSGSWAKSRVLRDL